MNNQNGMICEEGRSSRKDSLGLDSSFPADSAHRSPAQPRHLFARSQWLVPLRDFASEVRGPLDVQHLLANCAVLLDVEEMGFEDILMRMVEERPRNFGSEEERAPKSQNQRDKSQSIPFARIREKLFIHNGQGRGTVKQESALSLREHLQGIVVDAHRGITMEQSWIALYCPTDEDVLRPRVAFARLSAATNFGPELSELRFVILVIAPLQQKETKSAAEIARTFGTLMSASQLRNELANAHNEQQFIAAIQRTAQKLADESNEPMDHKNEKPADQQEENSRQRRWFPGRGLIRDLRRRLPFYKSDFLDGFSDSRSFQKSISSATFLYFIVLPTAIALGMLNEENTKGKITVTKAILGQCIGGLVFGLFGGQLFLMMLTSPPISIYITVIDRLSHALDYDFFQLYAGIGVWCCIYLLLFAFFEVSNVMKYAKRSLEELFSMFIACTLVITSVQAAIHSLGHAHAPHCSSASPHPGNAHPPPPPPPPHPPHHLPHPDPPPPPPPPHLDPLISCNRAVGLLFLLLMLGTAWTALSLANFRKTPFLGKRKREILSDYALPLAVLLMALIAHLYFGDVPKETFHLDPDAHDFTLGSFWLLPLRGQLVCCVLGFPLTILFMMDQMIVTETVDNSHNNLKKGPAANWDFLVVALLNVPLSLFGLPWMHAALPQSFLHLKAQADVEDRLVDGTVQQIIVKNRESRLATLLAHSLMVPTYLFALHLLHLLPTAVFRGVFLFLAVSSTIGNELCQRTLLFFTEQRSYPPAHYIRRVPQRIMHLFTAIELLQLGLLIAIGHCPWPLIRLLFPIALIVFIPLRAFVFPKFFKQKHLEVLDGTH